MRVFKDGRIAEKIVGEIINIEAGKLLYENGFPNSSEKPSLYPKIEHDDVVTTIHSNIGIIYIPNSINLTRFVEKNIGPLLEEKDKEHDYLSAYARLERKSSQFTAMKAKSTFTESVIGSVYDIEKKRIFIINTEQTDLGKRIFHNRFHWFIFPISVLIRNIETFENPRFPPTTQFVSIIYDMNDQLAVADGTKLESNITFNHFRVCQHLLSFNPLKNELQQEDEEDEIAEQSVNDDRQSTINQKKCPDCQRAFKSKGGLTRHINTQVCVKKKKKVEQAKKGNEKVGCPYCNRECAGEAGLTAHLRGCENAKDPNLVKEIKEKRELEQFKLLSTKEKSARIQELEAYPEYMAQWNDVLYDETRGIVLCSVRGAVFELIRYYGRWNIYEDQYTSGYIPIKEVSKPIYSEDFRNIVIDNSLDSSFDALNLMRKEEWPNSAQFDSNEICSRCFTPLYGEIYVAIHEKSRAGIAVCPTCMHFEPELWCEDKRIADYIILRVCYPMSVEKIIEKTTYNQEKKTVMKQSYSTKALFVDASSGDYAVYIGYDPKTHPNFKYIGWTGRIYNYINYANSDNEFYSSGPKEKLSIMAAQSQIFPIRMIRCQ